MHLVWGSLPLREAPFLPAAYKWLMDPAFGEGCLGSLGSVLVWLSLGGELLGEGMVSFLFFLEGMLSLKCSSIYYTWECVPVSATLSVHPLSVRLHPPHCVCSLCLRLCSYPANRFISAVFLDFHVCALIYDVHFPLSDFILYGRLHIHCITANDPVSLLLMAG